jgi:hypothetical protein
VTNSWLDGWRRLKHWRFRLALTVFAAALLLWRLYGDGPMAAFYASMGIVIAMVVYLPSDLRAGRGRNAP